MRREDKRFAYIDRRGLLRREDERLADIEARAQRRADMWGVVGLVVMVTIIVLRFAGLV